MGHCYSRQLAKINSLIRNSGSPGFSTIGSASTETTNNPPINSPIDDQKQDITTTNNINTALELIESQPPYSFTPSNLQSIPPSPSISSKPLHTCSLSNYSSTTLTPLTVSSKRTSITLTPLPIISYTNTSSMNIRHRSLFNNSKNTAHDTNTRSVFTHNQPTINELEENTSIDDNSCTCKTSNDSSILQFRIQPSIWEEEHSIALRYMLHIWNIQYLFDIIECFVREKNINPLKNEYYKRGRTLLKNWPFCPCWCKLFTDHKFRIVQFGYCPGTTQFALKFIQKHNFLQYSHTNFSEFEYENRSKFTKSIAVNNNSITLEIYDMNVAEFPTMIPSYLSAYDPHVILLMFDVCNRSSFNGICKMKKRLSQIYESLEEQFEHNHHRHKNDERKVRNTIGFAVNNLFSHNLKSRNVRSKTFSNVFSVFSKSKKCKTRAETLYSETNGKMVKNENICGCDTCHYHESDPFTISAAEIYGSMPPIVMVAIHTEMNDAIREISIEEGLALSSEWDVPYIETSAINGINVNDVFDECIRTRWVHDTYAHVRNRSRTVL